MTAFASSSAFAADYRLGTSLGFGGTGLSKMMSVEGKTQTISRSEGPGIFTVFAEVLSSETKMYGIEHARGFRLGPFSSGVSFSGAFMRWYPYANAPAMVKNAGTENTLLVRKYALFLGLSGGIAQGKISRDADKVPNVSGSGVYMGIRIGADLLLSPRHGLRPELITNSTFMAAEATAPTLSMFSLGCAWFYSI